MATQLEKAILLIDEKNSMDLNREFFEGKEYPKELLYSYRMSSKLLDIKPEASEALQIAARAQHICRWKIPRKDYPMTKIGYINWRNDLKQRHSQITGEILEIVGYETRFIERVSFLINKKLLKKDEESQTLEDVVCLVFLEYYFEAFSAKHADKKVIDILKKTWDKMSELGHQLALKLELSSKTQKLIQRAIA